MAWDSAYQLVNWFLLLPQCSVLIETAFFAWIAVITVTEVEEAAAMCFHYGSPVCCHPLRRQRGGVSALYHTQRIKTPARLS